MGLPRSNALVTLNQVELVYYCIQQMVEFSLLWDGDGFSHWAPMNSKLERVVGEALW